MKELIDISFSLANIIPTALLLFVVLYWVIVIFGAIDMDFIDIDLDLEAEIDLDAEFDSNVDAGDIDGEADISWINNILRFFNLGKIPLMVFMSFVALPLWLMVVNANYVLGNTTLLIGIAILIPSFIVCLFIAKVLTMPFIKVFAALNKGTEEKEILGRICEVTLPASFEMKGQAEIDADGSHILIYIKAMKPEMELKAGQTALVIEKDNQEECYLVEPYEHYV
ncbi:MAG: DUF1449 family protein [Flavobacteriales bacterium]|nr:DUF1449 family protein [Flavobacteriales bacterium]